MRKSDIVLLARFVSRKSSYVGEELKISVVSFIAGYEIGTDLKCDFTKKLTHHLEEQHQIPATPFGWPVQIEELSKQFDKDWMTTFKEVTLALIEGMIGEDSSGESNSLN